MQAVAPVQATLLSAVPPGVSGNGVCTNLQAVPFHDSARVNRVGFFGVPSLPTAMQLDELVQETPFRLAPLFLNTGVGSSVHAVPFHDSASGWSIRLPPGSWKTWVSPTAMQLVLLVHEMDVSIAPPPGRLGDGLGRTVQVLPFHDSARVKFWKAEVPPMRPRNVPTAM